MIGTRTGKTHMTLALIQATRNAGVPVLVLDSKPAQPPANTHGCGVPPCIYSDSAEFVFIWPESWFR